MDVVSQNSLRFLFFIITLYFSYLENAYCNRPINSNTFSVLDQGAKGDGNTNDAAAFEATWAQACKTEGGVMLIPSGYTFLIQPINFEGSNCQSNVTVQVDGKIVAPKISAYGKVGEYWILFVGLTKGIQIKGNGIIDGSGASWWVKTESTNSNRPHAMGISKSVNVIITGITIQNSPMMHIFITNCEQVEIYDFNVSSPEDSPNTDGIHLSAVKHAKIHNATLACGDDCVSIQTGSLDVKIHDVHCGPGHGYSIGGLGPNGQEANVSDITVLDSSVKDAQNGVRIKTWQGGSGSAKGIVFSGITMSNVRKPIVIDQAYCGGSKNCEEPNKNAVAISNVTYANIKGTYSYAPILLNCSKYVACKYLTFADIDIKPTPEVADNPPAPNCTNAFGQLSGTIVPSLDNCLKPSESVP